MAPTKASEQLLGLARDAAERLGAMGILLLPETLMDWQAVRAVTGEARVLVAVTSPRVRLAVENTGLVPVEVEPSNAGIAERITLALIEAVANDKLAAGDRVVVVYSGFEAEMMDSV